MTARVAPLGIGDIPAVTTLLTDAFAGDIGMRDICRGSTEAAYRRSLAAWFAATLRLHLARQQPAWVVRIDDEIVAAALLARSHERFALPGWPAWFANVGRSCGLGTIWRTAQHEQHRARYRPAEPHTVLEFIAVRSDYAGRGCARLLLDTCTQWSASQAVTGIWLETTQPSNVRLFEHFAYTVTGRMVREQGESVFLFRAND